MKYDIFISCKSEDYKYARQIYDFLTTAQAGCRVFLADAELRKRGQAEYGAIIDDALDTAEHLVVVASKPEYVRSSYVMNEWRTFLEEKRCGRKSGNIITIRKGVSISSLPISLRHYQSFDFADYKSIVHFLPLTQQGSTDSADVVSNVEESNIEIPSQIDTPQPTPGKPRFDWLKRRWKSIVAAIFVTLFAVVGVISVLNTLQKRIVVELAAKEQATCGKSEEWIVADGKGRDGVYKIGDYYNRNGKEGVVFEVSDDGRHGKIVSLKRSEKNLRWSLDGTRIGTDDVTNGANNMAKVRVIAGWHEKYLAFAWCADLGEGWYLPAKEELLAIYRNREIVEKTLCNMFTDDFSPYWSSTEEDEYCAWLVGMCDGYTLSGIKSTSYYVRAVSAF